MHHRHLLLLLGLALLAGLTLTSAASGHHHHGGAAPSGSAGSTSGQDGTATPSGADFSVSIPAPTRPAGAGAGGARPAQSATGGRGRVAIRVECAFLKMGTFDPIVFPGLDPSGHMHDFFGNTSINASSTTTTLLAANASRSATTCSNRTDGSAYWVPGLLADGAMVMPTSVVASYSRARSTTGRAVTFPAGFTVVRGDKSATTLQQDIGFRCGDAGTLAVAPPTCTGSDLVGVVRFASCWDGVNVSAAGSTHVALAVAGVCPATHPVSIPGLELAVHYPTDGLSHAWTLHSGNTAGYHADFMNGWTQRSIRRLAGCARS